MTCGESVGAEVKCNFKVVLANVYSSVSIFGIISLLLYPRGYLQLKSMEPDSKELKAALLLPESSLPGLQNPQPATYHREAAMV